MKLQQDSNVRFGQQMIAFKVQGFEKRNTKIWLWQEVSFKYTIPYSFVFIEQSYFHCICLMKITSMFVILKICQRCHLGLRQQITLIKVFCSKHVYVFHSNQKSILIYKCRYLSIQHLTKQYTFLNCHNYIKDNTLAF